MRTSAARITRFVVFMAVLDNSIGFYSGGQPLRRCAAVISLVRKELRNQFRIADIRKVWTNPPVNHCGGITPR
jgi:hypothetical protein